MYLGSFSLWAFAFKWFECNLIQKDWSSAAVVASHFFNLVTHRHRLAKSFLTTAIFTLSTAFNSHSDLFRLLYRLNREIMHVFYAIILFRVWSWCPHHSFKRQTHQSLLVVGLLCTVNGALLRKLSLLRISILRLNRLMSLFIILMHLIALLSLQKWLVCFLLYGHDVCLAGIVVD